MSLNNPLTPLLSQQPFVVLDGALATELEARGCNLADSLWSAKVLMEQPELIYAVHLDYFRAGRSAPLPPATRRRQPVLPRAGWMRRSHGR